MIYVIINVSSLEPKIKASLYQPSNKMTPLSDLINEIMALITQAVTFIFPVGIAIYVFKYKNWKENLDKYDITNIVMEQHERVSRKIIRLFFTGAGTILYAITTKIVTSQIVLSDYILWLLLGGLISLLILTFFFFHSVFVEIGLIYK